MTKAYINGSHIMAGSYIDLSKISWIGRIKLALSILCRKRIDLNEVRRYRNGLTSKVSPR